MVRSMSVFLVAIGCVAGCSSPRERLTPPPSAPAPRVSVVPAVTRMTVGELLAKGGKQLTATEVKTLFSGAIVEGAESDSDWRERNAPDGDVTGQSFMHDGQAMNYQGTWWVDDQGRRCWANSRGSGSGPSCMYYYILGGKYYASDAAGSVRNGALAERKISR